jgi:prepilin-type N-terminal cleavage/methylation domain-containing protein
VSKQDGFSLIETLAVVGLVGVVAAIAVPMSGNAIRYAKISGDARNLSNDLAVTKMRAAAGLTQARLFVDVGARTYYLQTCNSPSTAPCPAWTTGGGTQMLSSSVSFGYGGAAAPPADTQSTIGQASPCKSGSPAAEVPNTACVIFNSRGIPVDAIGNPTGSYAIYITDNSAIYGITIAATGFTRLWRSTYSAAAWTQQ